MLVAILQMLHPFQPLTVIADDVHLLDDATWSWLSLLTSTCSMRRLVRPDSTARSIGSGSCSCCCWWAWPSLASSS